MFCSLWYQIFWNPWFSFDLLYFCHWRGSIVLSCARISPSYLHYQACNTKYWRCSIDIRIQITAGSVSLLHCPRMPRTSHQWMSATNWNLHYRMVTILLMLILRIRQWPRYYLLCVWQQPLWQLWITATKSPINCSASKTKNRWHFVDTDFPNLAATVSLALLPMKAANRLVIHNNKPITAEVLYFQDQEFLILR